MNPGPILDPGLLFFRGIIFTIPLVFWRRLQRILLAFMILSQIRLGIRNWPVV